MSHSLQLLFIISEFHQQACYKHCCVIAYYFLYQQNYQKYEQIKTNKIKNLKTNPSNEIINKNNKIATNT